MTFFLIVFGILLLLFLFIRSLQYVKKLTDWSAGLTYPSSFGIASALFLLGYHVGIYSHLYLFSYQFRLPVVGWSIATTGATIAWFFLIRKKISWLTLSYLLLFCGSGLLLPFTSNGFIQSFNVVTQLICTIGLLINLIYNDFNWTAMYLIRTVGFFVPAFLIQIVRIVRQLVGYQSSTKARIGPWIKTVVIVCGVLIVFMWILSEADPVFAEVIREFRSQLFGRTITTIILLLGMSGFITITIRPESEKPERGWISHRDVFAAVSALTILLAVFLFIQFKYIFLGSTELLNELNLTFSEYVRKGFMELLMATFIGGALSYLLTVKSRQHPDEKLNFITIIVNIVLVIELMLILLSAFKRDLLYVDTYGLTRVRIVGGIFLLWLAGFLGCLSVFTLNRNLRESRILLTLWIISCITWAVLNGMNIDKQVVTGAPGHHLYTDYFYLMQLSEDVMAEKIQMLPEIQQEIEMLTQKKSLSAVEKYQLAGLKLSLATFIEKRNRLYLFYAPESWLLENGWRIGQQFEDGDDIWDRGINGVEMTRAQGWENTKIKKRTVPESLKKMRLWAFTNRNEHAAYQMIQNDEVQFFENINKLYLKIRSYQMITQTSLSIEENKLLYEFKYPFLSTGLRSFSPEELNPVYIPDHDQIDARYLMKNEPFIQLEESNTYTLKEINELTCSSQPLSTEIYAVLINYSSSVTLDTIATLRPLLDKEPLVGVLIPASVKLRLPAFIAEREAQSRGEKRDSVFINPNEMPTSIVSTQMKTFVRIGIETDKVTESGTCWARPRATHIQGMYGFQN